MSEETKPTIVVIGRFNAGLTIRTPRMPVVDESLMGDSFNMGAGGKGSNQAVAAARLGARSYLVACLGEDLFGQMAMELYTREGVDTTFIRRVVESYTGAAVIIIDHERRSRSIVDVGASALLSRGDVERAAPAICESGALLAVLGLPLPAVARGLELAHREKILTILNPAPAQPLDANLLRHVDILTPNETEVRMALGLAPDHPIATDEAAGRLLRLGPRAVIVTLGEQGALIVTRDGLDRIPPYPVHAVDPTGAGDAFNAALAVALAQGRELTEAVRFANAAGALTTTKVGVIPALPMRAQVEDLCR